MLYKAHPLPPLKMLSLAVKNIPPVVCILDPSFRKHRSQLTASALVEKDNLYLYTAFVAHATCRKRFARPPVKGPYHFPVHIRGIGCLAARTQKFISLVQILGNHRLPACFRPCRNLPLTVRGCTRRRIRPWRDSPTSQQQKNCTTQNKILNHLIDLREIVDAMR